MSSGVRGRRNEVDDDSAAANNVGTLCVFQPTYPCLETVKKITDMNANALIHQTLPGRGGFRTGGSRRDRVWVWHRDKAGAETSTPHCRA